MSDFVELFITVISSACGVVNESIRMLTLFNILMLTLFNIMFTNAALYNK